MNAASAKQNAMTGTITGDKIQQVGFRAMIQKQAIMYDVAGSARNNPNGTVTLSLQGDKNRIKDILDAIRAGSKKSSKNNKVDETSAALDPDLKTFTVFSWTSTTRNITTPYDLVFTLRHDDSEISAHDAEKVWNGIAESTLKGDDLTKFKDHLDKIDE